MRDAGVDYHVTKNTLLRFAAEKAQKTEINSLLSGPLAVAFGYEDSVKAAKALHSYINTAASTLKITGGIFGSKLMSIQDVVTLASLPAKEVILAQLFGQLKAPIQSFHTVLSSPLSGFVNVLNARVQQMESGT